MKIDFIVNNDSNYNNSEKFNKINYTAKQEFSVQKLPNGIFIAVFLPLFPFTFNHNMSIRKLMAMLRVSTHTSMQPLVSAMTKILKNFYMNIRSEGISGTWNKSVAFKSSYAMRHYVLCFKLCIFFNALLSSLHRSFYVLSLATIF
jgi:hypothetical protein